MPRFALPTNEIVRTTTITHPSDPSRPHPRHGYDRHWWAKARPDPRREPSYWQATRSPLASLVVVLPVLACYEIGVLLNGSTARSGVDSWIRIALERMGIHEFWLPPIVLLVGLLGWQAAGERSGRLRVRDALVMILECLALAIALVGLSRVVDLGLTQLDHAHIRLQVAAPATAASNAAPLYLGYLGAGIYEEVVFRLLLIPLLLGALRVCLVPKVLAGALAISGSALLFAVAHHAGAPGEPFTWFAFTFRWFAGLYFAWIFVLRGFGIAVGVHVAYDCMVGLLSVS